MVSLCLVPRSAVAETPPDAGSILRDIQPPPKKPPAQAPQVIIPEGDKPVVSDLAVRVRVQSFRIRGATLIAEEELLAQLRDWVGREISLVQLKLAAMRLAEYYREQGFLARAYLPRQTIEEGVVEIVIVEARLGDISIGAPYPKRADADFAREALLARQPIGEPVRLNDILQALRILNETPGFAATAVASPGKQEGETDLTLKLEDTPLFSGLAMIDNHGAKATGTQRKIASLNINNPTHGGDQISLMLLGSTPGNRYKRLGYSFPAGRLGTRASLAMTRLDYRLGDKFADLDANGWARLVTATVSHPLLRGAESSATLSVAIEKKHFVNNANGANTSDKTVRLLTGSLSGEWRDMVGGGYTGGTDLVFGNADLGRNRDDLAADQNTARTHGRFTKLQYNLARIQPVGKNDDAVISLTGQWADGNLDSGEKFSLGGPSGVRSYPIGEASGDTGWLVSAEWRHRIGEQIQITAFLDTGSLLLHKHPWEGWDGANPGQHNRYTLTGSGLSATWKRPGNFVMTAGWATRIGDNPGADINGLDNDGTRDEHRWWWQFTKLF